MNRLFFLIAFLFIFQSVLFQSVLSQQAKQLVFREETHDFGNVAENKGPVTHEFVFTNSTSRPVKVLNVQASCGCTTPGWSKDVVAPGKTGYIQASFDPKGRPGFFTKSLTVTTDLDANPIVLQIKGQVSGDSEDYIDPTGFTIANGNLKFKNSSFNMGKVFMKDEYAVKEFQVLNSGSKPVTFKEKVTGPNHIKAEVKPTTLAPGGKATIKVSYNGKLKNQYGFQSDNIEFATDDAENPVKSFSVFATIEDYFPQLSADELKKAPQLQLGVSSLDLGRVNPQTSVVREVNFKNTGRTELLVKAVQGNCVCIKASTSKAKLKPGESASVKLEFTPQDRSGTQQKAVTIYSNDPRNPVQRFTFSAYVE
jgi:hypothetical protein